MTDEKQPEQVVNLNVPIGHIMNLLGSLVGATSRLHEDVVLSQPKYQDDLSIVRHRAQMYSQNGEDGMIAEIFRRIGAHDKFFVEIGAGDGSQNCTRFLLEQGWRGIWWEAGVEECKAIRKRFANEIAGGALTLIEGMVTVENVAQLLHAEACPYEFDLLSLDVDMNTSHIWRAMIAAGFLPRVAVIEYNPNVPACAEYEVPYRADAVWDGTRTFGASLKTLRILADSAYLLVGCELTGINAFFVRKGDDNAGRFQRPFEAEHHYEPPRFHMLIHGRGHIRR